MGSILKITDTKYRLTATQKRYTIRTLTGGFARKQDIWHWAETVVVDANVFIVTNDQLKKTISPIIFLSGTPTNWEQEGIVQDKTAGTLDFSNYSFAETPGSGEFSGYIDFQYKG